VSQPYTLPLGSLAPDFDLKGTDGNRYEFAGVAGSVGTVVMFTCNHCPYVLGSDANTAALAIRFAENGINFVAINSNSEGTYAEDGFEGMAERMEREAFPWPYLHDETQAVALAYGALRTPHFFLFDADRRLVYTGRAIDTPKDWTLATSFELESAIEALIAGEDISISQTNPIGCNIKWDGKERHWMPPEACDLPIIVPGAK